MLVQSRLRLCTPFVCDLDAPRCLDKKRVRFGLVLVDLVSGRRLFDQSFKQAVNPLIAL